MVFYYPDDISIPALATDINDVHTLASGNPFHITRIDEVNQLTSKIRVAKTLRIYGRSGMGKSTILPKLIAHSQRRTVIVILPDDDEAYRAYENYSSRPDRGLRLPTIPSAHIIDDSFELDSARLIWTSYRSFISWLFARRSDANYYDLLKDKIVLIDQAESPKYDIRIMDTVIAPLKPAKYLSITSATDLPAAIKPDTNPVRTFPAALTPDIWDIMRDGEPWSLKSDESTTLIYTSNHELTQQLCNIYDNNGVTTKTLTSGSRSSDFLETIETIYPTTADNHTTGKRLIVFVDDSYRIGYHFGISTIIDISSFEYLYPFDTPEIHVDAERDDKNVFVLDDFEPNHIVVNIHDAPPEPLSPEAYYESISNILFVLATADRGVMLPAEYWVCAARRSMEPNVGYINLTKRDITCDIDKTEEYSTLTYIFNTFSIRGSFQYYNQPGMDLTVDEIAVCIRRYNSLGIELSAMRRAVIDNFYNNRGIGGTGISRLKFVPALVRVSNLMSLERYILRKFLDSDLRTRKALESIPTVNGKVDTKTRRYKWLLLGRFVAASRDPDCGEIRFRVRYTSAVDLEEDSDGPTSDSDIDSIPSWASETSPNDDIGYGSSSSFGSRWSK